MRLVTLVENTCGREGCTAEHGLCIYAETPRHRLLLDAGQTDALIHNAEVLGVDLSAVDTLVLSHGHYDHAGGILPFAKVSISIAVGNLKILAISSAAVYSGLMIMAIPSSSFKKPISSL